MKNTFTGAVLSFANRGIHLFCDEGFNFRKQLTVRPEFRAESGWNNALNDFMKSRLEELAETVKRVTYSTTTSDPAANKAARIADAKNTDATLADAFDGKSINTDEIVMAAPVVDKQLAYDLTGADPNVPQPTPELLPNDIARAFVIGVDNLIVAATNLDSRTQPATINAMEAAQLLTLLNEMYALCMLKGGEENRVETPTGVLPVQRASTFNADGAADPKPTA